jgi:RNA polymerase sigma-70 factor (ECF subfamily)
MDEQQIIPHLFRTEYRKITAVLCKLFGIKNLQIAEDIASETFLAAMETWTFNGIPENPTAWLYLVARNKARNYFSRKIVFDEKIADEIRKTAEVIQQVDIDLSERNITDSQLQMLFALCHPTISPEAQVGLSLRILCGFGIDEIADAFLTTKEVINKRLYRAREKLRAENVRIEFPGPEEVSKRLDAVLTTLYLLFSEGYYSERQDSILRKDLCLEAMRLTQLLIENEKTDTPPVNALLSLMCFHVSRFDARTNEEGEMILYHDQDEAHWNRELISKGGFYLNRASRGSKVSKYHLEAGVAYWFTVKEDTYEKWENILSLYNKRLMLEYSPIAALNRTFALSKVHGKEAAIAEAEKLNLSDNHFYFVLMGHLYCGVDDGKAKLNFERAFNLARTNSDKRLIQLKIEAL